MTDFDKEEFWKSLGRLYDETVALKEQAAAVNEAAGKLVIATGKLQSVAELHEKRLDKLEVVQQWLAEKERNQEKDGGQ